MKKDIEKYVRFYKDIQQIERRLRRATDSAIQLGIDAVLADKMETARQGIEDHLARSVPELREVVMNPTGPKVGSKPSGEALTEVEQNK